MKCFLLILCVFLSSCEKGNRGLDQINKQEKMNVDLGDKFEKDSDFLYKLPNGNQIYMMENPKGNSLGLQYEREPIPSFFTVYKEFYPDGFIKKKETRFGQYTKVGISEYYDEKGNLTEKNEDEKFGKIKPSDILKILDKKQLINISTGAGRLSENGTDAFTVKFNENKDEYMVTMQDGKPNKNPEFGIGEPPAFVSVTYIINGETGEVNEL